MIDSRSGRNDAFGIECHEAEASNHSKLRPITRFYKEIVSILDMKLMKKQFKTPSPVQQIGSHAGQF
jgi:hypothetical protein